MRGREFLMKDAYSFDLDHRRHGTLQQDDRRLSAHLRVRMGLKSIPMRAESGPIGGNLSHEFHHSGADRSIRRCSATRTTSTWPCRSPT